MALAKFPMGHALADYTHIYIYIYLHLKETWSPVLPVFVVL